MKKFALSKFAEQLKPSATFEIEKKVKEIQRQSIKVYNFNLGEPDFDTPDSIKSAAIEAILQNKTKYTEVAGTLKLRQTICDKFKRDNNLTYQPHEIMVSNGVKQVLYSAVRTICGIGDEVIVLAPYWTSYPHIVRLAGGKPVVVKSRDFRLSAKDIQKAVTRKTKAIIINSPNNPAGIVYTAEELKEFAELVLRNRILVISDEIYENFLYEEARHFSFASLDQKFKEYVLTMNGVSKTYAMTGWRIGYCAGPAYIIEKMADLQSHISSNACSISQEAAAEALLCEQDLIRKMVKTFDKRRQFICGEFEKAKIKFAKPEGAYYVFFKVSPQFSSIDFCRFMLENFQVALNPGETFGVPGWVRLSYTVDSYDIEEGIRRISKWLEK